MVPKYLLLALLVGVVALTTSSDDGYKPPETKPAGPVHKPPVPKLPPPGHKPPTTADEKKVPVDQHKPPSYPGGHKPPTLADVKDVENGDGHIPKPEPKPYGKPPVHVKPPGPYKPPYKPPHKPPHKPPSTDHLN